MRIKWGFLTSLTLLCVSTAATDLRGDEKSEEKPSQQASADGQVPMRADVSRGWGTPAGLPAQTHQHAGHDHGPTGWPVAPAVGGYPGFPAGAVLPASMNGPVMPQPFPGPAAAPLAGAGPVYGGGAPYGDGYGGEYSDVAPYPGPFDGWIDGSADCAMCGGAGCDNCAGQGGGLLGWLITGMRPFPEGGICTPPLV